MSEIVKNKKLSKCVECGEELPEGRDKVHLDCALYAIGEISEDERKKMVEDTQKTDSFKLTNAYLAQELMLMKSKEAFYWIMTVWSLVLVSLFGIELFESLGSSNLRILIIIILVLGLTSVAFIYYLRSAIRIMLVEGGEKGEER